MDIRWLGRVANASTTKAQRHKGAQINEQALICGGSKKIKGSFMNNSLAAGRSRYPPAGDRAGLAERLEGGHPRWRTTARGREALQVDKGAVQNI